MGRRSRRRKGGDGDGPSPVPRHQLAEPTSVLARRAGQWFIDVVVCGLAAAVPALVLGNALLDETRVGDERFTWIDGVLAVKVRDTYIWYRQEELAVIGGVLLLASLLVWVVLPGRRGWSPGMLAADLRVVRRDGERPGLGRALVRTLLWVLDAIPGLPLVGYGVASVSNRHQRIGDHVARTWVVDKHATGVPVGTAVELDDPVVEDLRAEPEPPPEPEPETAAEPEPTASEPIVTPEPEPRPVAAAARTPDPAPGPAAQVAPPEGVPRDEPIWDRRHRRYVMWHSRAGRWLEHTDEGWAPLDD